MKREITGLLALALAGSLLASGCVSHRRAVVVTPTGEVVVPEPPPTGRTEIPGAPPSSSYVWVGGYWSYDQYHWVWLPGHWETPPREGSTWVSGHWHHSVRGWTWTPGHWE